MGFLSRLAQAQRQAQGEASAPAPRPTLIQGGPAFFTPEGYTPPIQPEQAFMPTDVMRDPIADMFAAQPPSTRGPSLPKPPIPPRDDQIFIDDMPPMREEPPMDFPQPMPEPKDDLKVGTLGGAGYGRFPLGTAGPEFIYDDDGNPIMEPKPGLGNFNFLDLYKNQMPKRDDFMSIGGPGGGQLLRGGETPPSYKEPINRIGNYNLEQRKIDPTGGTYGDRTPPSVGDGMFDANNNPFLPITLGSGIVPEGQDPSQKMPTKPDMLPNLATGVMEPVGQPMPQLPQGPQPIPQVPSPIMPPMREVPPEDFGFGPGIRRSEDFFRGEDLIMPPMAPPKPLGEDVPPMPMENIIRANDPAIMPMPSKMPMLPEPMPMPSPMPIRPRMPMPGPIATPISRVPTNLQLPQIETQMPMMSLDRGIGSFKTLV